MCEYTSLIKLTPSLFVKMNRHFSRISLALASLAIAQGASAQMVDLLAEKPIFTLGPAKTWTGTDGERTFDPETLTKIVAVPTNTSNIYLFYEGGGFNTDANKEIGIQGFYIDMESEQEVSVVSSTWEGAAASAYDIYLTNDVPTLDILETEPTYSATALGQYTSNKATLPEGSKGRYLVFQPTNATNYGWGVKIRSMSAIAPYVSELTTFTVSPSMARLNTPVPVSFTFSNQLDEPIDPAEVTVTVSDNATYEDGILTIKEGTEAVFTAKMGEKELTCTVAAIAEAPGAPGKYKEPIFLSNDEELDATINLMVGYNGGATRLDNVAFPDGEIALAFTDTRCVFFGNSATLGNWNTKLNPVESGFRNLHMEVYVTKDVTANITFEGAGDRQNNNVQLTANKWNSVDVNLVGIETINNYSIRFSEADMCDALVTNIYFTALYVEGDETAPVLDVLEAEGGQGNVTFTLKATDDLNDVVDFNIEWPGQSVTVEGKSGEEFKYVVEGLAMGTEYTFSVKAGDGLNWTDPQTVTVKTEGLEDAPAVTIDTEKYDVVAVFSYSLGATVAPGFDAWGSAGTYGTIATDNGQNVLYFTNYYDQWGGLNIETELGDVCNTLHMDIFPIEAPENCVLEIAPVWTDANGATTPNKVVDLKGNVWNHVELPLSDFGYPQYGTKIGQFAVNHPNFSSFVIGNFYFTGEKIEDAVESVGVEDGAAEYFNLQGVRVNGELTPGLYIRLQNGKSTKVLVK